MKDDITLFTGYLDDDKLYRLELENNNTCINHLNIKKEDLQDYYHKALGHMSPKNMKIIEERLKIKIDLNRSCEECMKSKIKSLPFKISTSRATEPLQLIHMELLGIIRIPNALNYSYFLLLTDDYSRYRVTYVLNDKTQVVQSIKNFVAYFENQLNSKVKKLRSDNGTEFKNEEINEFCLQY